jgi:hypothetical protein
MMPRDAPLATSGHPPTNANNCGIMAGRRYNHGVPQTLEGCAREDARMALS